MEIIVDDQDRWLLSEYRWYIQRSGPYAFRKEKAGGKWRTVYLHRQITGAGRGQLVDHKNRNGLDCRRENLRLCSHAQNMQNSKPRADGSVGAKGVSKNRSGFKAEIKSNGVRHHLGTFPTVEQAAAAYQSAAKKLNGEFARTA